MRGHHERPTAAIFFLFFPPFPSAVIGRVSGSLLLPRKRKHAARFTQSVHTHSSHAWHHTESSARRRNRCPINNLCYSLMCLLLSALLDAWATRRLSSVYYKSTAGASEMWRTNKMSSSALWAQLAKKIHFPVGGAALIPSFAFFKPLSRKRAVIWAKSLSFFHLVMDKRACLEGERVFTALSSEFRIQEAGGRMILKTFFGGERGTLG